jgi:HSP20 family protein
MSSKLPPVYHSVRIKRVRGVTVRDLILYGNIIQSFKKLDMTLVKFNNRPAPGSFNNFFEDFFQDLPSIWTNGNAGYRNGNVPANIRETNDGFVLELVAPGFEKSDFRIQLENEMLTVAAESKAEKEEANDKQLRKEFRFHSFSRSFHVGDQVDTEKIDAGYESGILTLNLPKKKEVKAAAKQITIQ